MSWATFAALVSGKRPVWLYEITIGATVSRLTSKRGGYTYGGNSYTQTPLYHSGIRSTAAINRAEVSLLFPRTNDLALSIRDTIDAADTRIKILQGDENDPDNEFLTFFDGRIVTTRPNLVTIDLVCENRFTAFRRKAISRPMQRPCSHSLYHRPTGGGGCPVDKEAFYTSDTATAWGKPVLTVTGASGQADGYYSGGLLRFGTLEMMITKHVGTSLTLLAPVTGLAEEIVLSGSASVEIAPGCNRTLTTCNDRFGVVEDHGGFPQMTDTPFDGRSIF